MSVVIILPTQLFKENILITKNSKVYIIEHPIYFTKYKFHRMKLVMHRATMQYYKDYLKKRFGCKTKYIEFNENYKKIFSKHKEINIYDPVDHEIHKELAKYSKEYDIKINIYETPLFFINTNDLKEYLGSGGTYHQTSFYGWLRKKYNILMKNGKPIGGKLTYDRENRMPFPDNINIDEQLNINKTTYVKEAINYVIKHFNTNIGDLEYYLPVTHKEAHEHLISFVNKRLNKFGPYEDASNSNIIIGFHSILSPLLNIGLITDIEVIEMILKKNVPIQSKEGFIRQITGWRNIMRLMYIEKYNEMKTLNYFGHNNKLDKSWYDGTTGIIVIDNLIKKVIRYGYAHHIERLMFLGNFMLLSKTKPNEVFKWFMTLFLDAYDWVMMGNVFAMSQYSTGPLLMRRPYFSSSNYISKMSNYNRVKNKYPAIIINNKEYEWYELWDILYYNFVYDNRKIFAQNYSTASSVQHLNNKNNDEIRQIRYMAKKFIGYKN